LTNFGYKTSKFLTFKQICQKGGAVISGEKSYPIFFSSWSYKFNFMGNELKVTAFSESEAIDLANKKFGTTIITKAHLKDKFCFTKYFNVFNLEQSEGVEYEEDNTVFAKANEILKAQDIDIRETNGFVKYDNTKKILYIPDQEDLKDNEYYPEIFRSLCKHYLVDEDIEYYEMQMVTHIASAFLSQSCGLEAPVISIAEPTLVENWLEKLNESYYFLWRCSTKAQQIHDLILEKIQEAEDVA
jgi:antirestriction protein ArdC